MQLSTVLHLPKPQMKITLAIKKKIPLLFILIFFSCIYFKFQMTMDKLPFSRSVSSRTTCAQCGYFGILHWEFFFLISVKSAFRLINLQLKLISWYFFFKPSGEWISRFSTLCGEASRFSSMKLSLHQHRGWWICSLDLSAPRDRSRKTIYSLYRPVLGSC